MLTLRKLLCWLLGHDPPVLWVGLQDDKLTVVPRGHCRRCGKEFEAADAEPVTLELAQEWFRRHIAREGDLDVPDARPEAADAAGGE